MTIGLNNAITADETRANTLVIVYTRHTGSTTYVHPAWRILDADGNEVGGSRTLRETVREARALRRERYQVGEIRVLHEHGEEVL